MDVKERGSSRHLLLTVRYSGRVRCWIGWYVLANEQVYNNLFPSLRVGLVLSSLRTFLCVWLTVRMGHVTYIKLCCTALVISGTKIKRRERRKVSMYSVHREETERPVAEKRVY